jgi:hypothetical protein
VPAAAAAPETSCAQAGEMNMSLDSSGLNKSLLFALILRISRGKTTKNATSGTLDKKDQDNGGRI